MKRNGYCWGIVGVNGAKTRAHVISLDARHSCACLLLSHIPMFSEALFSICEVEYGPAITNELRNKFISKNLLFLLIGC